MRKYTQHDGGKVREEINGIFHRGGVLAPKRIAKRKGCQFYKDDGERFCTCTTNKTCRGCHFYTPTRAEEYALLVNRTLECEAEAEKAAEEAKAYKERYMHFRAVVMNRIDKNYDEAIKRGNWRAAKKALLAIKRAAIEEEEK